MMSQLLLLLVASLAIYLSSNLAIDAVRKIAPIFKVSKVTLSLLVLGVVTALPEIAVTLNSVALSAPQIAVGNLIGSQVFIIFVIIPVLAVVTNNLSVQLQLKNVSLALTLLLALVPIVGLYDQTLGLLEVAVIIVLYCTFAFLYTQKSHAIQRMIQHFTQPSGATILWQTVVLLLSCVVLLLASNTAVRSIIEIAAVLQTPRFLLSMIVLPIATNLPELSLAMGVLGAPKRELALSDLLGSITINSLLLAVLALGLGGSIAIGQSITVVIFLFVVGSVAFWIACASKELLSAKEGLLLFIFYLLLMVAAGWQVMSAFG